MKTPLVLAVAALISPPVAAQTARPADTSPTASAAAKGMLYEMKAGQWRATKLSGLDVYNEGKEKIGDISELIIDRDGRVAAVAVGVGGVLGMGERVVAVPFNQVQWIDAPIERTVSSRTTTTAGSGTSTAPTTIAPTPTAPITVERRDHSVTTTTTTTNADRAGGNGGMDRAPATTTERTTTTAVDRPTTMADRSAARDAYRGYPDHAVISMTKEQLKALPEVRYAR